MTTPSDRPRAHPEDRFAAPQHYYDLAKVQQQLTADASHASQQHRQMTLYKGGNSTNGPTTIALFTFDKGAHFPRHAAPGVVSIHVIAGHIRVLSGGQKFQLLAHQLLIISPGVEHELYAEQDSQMLLTVCLEPMASK